MTKVQKKDLREFGIIFGIGLPLIIGILLPLIFKHDFRFWTFYIGFFVLLISIIYPSILKLPYKVWLKFGNVMGWINLRLILGLVFILILIPISLIMKLFGYDPLSLKNRKVNTFKNKVLFSVDLERIF